MRIEETHERLATALGRALLARGMRVATAESCTGGLVAAAITSVAGSSEWFERGFVTYSNDAKCELLGVPPKVIEAHGAVSEAVARAMADGALARSHADCTVSVTGIAGPGGGTVEKPVGMVCFGWTLPMPPTVGTTRHFDGGRAGIRVAAVEAALSGLIELLDARLPLLP
jgi:nicotinamide-nucleotide amidase